MEKPVTEAGTTAAEESPADPVVPSDDISSPSLTNPTPAPPSAEIPTPEVVVPAAVAPVTVPTAQAEPSAAVQAQPSAVVAQAHSQMHAAKAPVWLDGMIFFLVSITVGLFAKKILYMY